MNPEQKKRRNALIGRQLLSKPKQLQGRPADHGQRVNIQRTAKPTKKPS